MIDELKQWEYDKGYQQGRADAIEEFAELLKEHIDNNGTKTFTDGMQMLIFSKHYIDALAEQLKEQNK